MIAMLSIYEYYFLFGGGGVKIMYNLDGVYRYTAHLLH